MTRRPRKRRDTLEAAIEAALDPGRFIGYREDWDFVSDLEDVARKIEGLVLHEALRAASLYETFLAGCYEKAEEVDDSSGMFGTLVGELQCGWIKARQAARADADETARRLLARMDDDPYGFTYRLESDAVKVMDAAGLAAFERQVKNRFDRATGSEPGAESARRRWGDVLRATHLQRRDVASYVALCQATTLSEEDCLAIAGMLKARRKAHEALAWVQRGLDLGQKRPHGSMATHDLVKLKRELLTKMGRGGDALEEAWADFREYPSTVTYQELMRFVPKGKRASWHAKAMGTVDRADLGSAIELLLETKEIERLVERLRAATDAELEVLSHYRTGPAARRLARTYPDVAARVYRALGMRILNAKKSRYYDAALSSFEDARRCFERAGLWDVWQAVVGEVRAAHHRKVGFLADFERLVAGRGRGDQPSFLERARSRWSPGKRH